MLYILIVATYMNVDMSGYNEKIELGPVAEEVCISSLSNYTDIPDDNGKRTIHFCRQLQVKTKNFI
jgi:hypothetical protein